MPKRKSDDSYEKLFKKIRKLEKKLRRRLRSSSSSRDAELQGHEHLTVGETNKNTVAELLDGGITVEPETLIRDCVTETGATAADDSIAEPSTSAIPGESISSITTYEITEATDGVPGSVILEILGEDPTFSDSYGTEIHNDLVIRLEHIATHSLTKELRKEIAEKYLLPNNCKLVNAPSLNAEIKAAISDINFKRDKSIETRQRQTAIAISCISRVINKQICNNNADPEMTKALMDAERILCDLQYSDSVIRRNFILSSLKKEMKEQLLNTKPDNLLFGQNLSETIKTAKAINRSGAELKTPVPKQQATNKKQPSQASTSSSLNLRGPFTARKQMSHPKTKGPAMSDRPSNPSKHSRQQLKRSRR